MASITAVLHTENDGLRLGRALETLYPCDEILVVDDGSHDDTIAVAREYGARVVDRKTAPSAEQWMQFIHKNWILCLDPRESLTESLAASLYEWKQLSHIQAAAFSVHLREEQSTGWSSLPDPQTRLVQANWKHWHGNLPAREPSAAILEGELLRFAFP